MGQSNPFRRILVVDDNVDAASLIAEIMSMYGHASMVALSGAEALAKVLVFEPDVVFLDIGMPGMNGFEVAAEMRRMPGLEALRIVALTAWGEASFRERSASVGFDAHLVKPADFAELLSEACRQRGAASSVKH